ncbi:MAG: cytochrome c [Elusimicrobia bacterium]|nr:cytochrome c [Elusimicrobiota bacterium]
MNRRLIFSLVSLLALTACSRQPESIDPVVRGERDFNGLGCVKCHMIGENGNEWGPNLTLVGFRKSPEWLDVWLKNPHNWNAKSIMPNFALTDGTRADLVAYLSAQKGQAWTVYPWRTDEAKALPAIERGKLIFNKAGCVACHGQFGGGGYPNNNVAGGLIPSLTLVSDGYSKPELHAKIQNGSIPLPNDPSAPPALIHMPKWGDQLKPDEIDALVEYLYSLKPKPAPGSAAAKDDF